MDNENTTTQPTQNSLPPTQGEVSATNTDIEVSEEDKHFRKELEQFERFPKLKKWALLFTDKNNKATYGNRTESAMQAYNCKDRTIAASIGAQNFKKLKGLATIFAEDQGVTFEKFLETAMARALTSENPQWWKMMAEVLGYKDPDNAQTVVNNNVQNNTQINVNEAEKVDFNLQFRKFIESS